MMWPSKKAEQWMRENPGRWLEDDRGRMWHFDARTDSFYYVDTRGTYDIGTVPAGRDFHPPREVRLAAVRELVATWRQLAGELDTDWCIASRTCANDLEALAAELDG